MKTFQKLRGEYFFELSDSAAAIINLKGMVILVNPAFEQLYGWSLAEIKGNVFRMFRIN
ncbi:PAS domain S-box protein [Bacillus sp. N9]